jgi:hypothetical protein
LASSGSVMAGMSSGPRTSGRRVVCPEQKGPAAQRATVRSLVTTTRRAGARVR